MENPIEQAERLTKARQDELTASFDKMAARALRIAEDRQHLLVSVKALRHVLEVHGMRDLAETVDSLVARVERPL